MNLYFIKVGGSTPWDSHSHRSRRLKAATMTVYAQLEQDELADCQARNRHIDACHNVPASDYAMVNPEQSAGLAGASVAFRFEPHASCGRLDSCQLSAGGDTDSAHLRIRSG